MKILKYEKIKNNQYKLYLDDSTTINLYDEIILNYNLLIKKTINNQELPDIIASNDFYVAYYKAIKYLNIKMRTKKEIAKYLKKDFNDSIIDKVINKISKEGYLNDESYASSYVNNQINLTNNGYNKILRNLNELDIPEDIAKKYLDKVTKDIWQEKIKKLINKKLKNNKKISEQKMKEKLIYDLVNQGYNRSDINNILDEVNISDDNALKKTYDILLNKLTKKYSGKELELHLLTKLMNNGFKYNDIKNIMQQKKNE